jgi:hypothetical protein
MEGTPKAQKELRRGADFVALSEILASRLKPAALRILLI